MGQVMGETGIRIVVRIMGLLLVALAMRHFVNGITDLGLIPKCWRACFQPLLCSTGFQ
jgi:MarC family integral membrane protein